MAEATNWLPSEESAHWLLRPKSEKWFHVSSLVVMLSALFMPFVYIVGTNPNLHNTALDVLVRISAMLVGIVAAPMAIYILVGMVWYWARFDSSSRMAKTLWFISFLIIGWYAAAVYFFVVYRQQRRVSCEAG